MDRTTELIVKEATTSSGHLKFWCVSHAGVTEELEPLVPVIFIQVLQPDDIVLVLEISSMRNGKRRARTKFGWVSLVSANGTVLMKPIDSAHLAMEAKWDFRNGETASAVELWKEAVARDPSPRDLVNLATAYCKLAEYEQALAAVEQAITADASYAKAFYRKGRILAAVGDPQAAQMNLEKALELQPDDLQILCCLAKVHCLLSHG